MNPIFVFLLVAAAAAASASIAHGDQRISSLKVHSGVKMNLRQKHAACDDTASTGDSTFDHVSCMVKRSLQRASKLKAALYSSNGASGSEFESPLSSGGGDYVTTISIGTPPTEYPVIADTGSDLLWIQCQPCDQCFDQEPAIFDPRNSSSYASRRCSHDSMCQALPRKGCSPNNECMYLYGYGDGSTTRGTLASESMTLTTTEGDAVTVKNFAFGCGHKNTGKYPLSAGLMGLGRGKLSFVSQLGNLFENRFSYCLVPWKDDPSTSSPMYFGGGGPEQSDPSKYEFTPMVKNSALETFYYVKLVDVSVSGDKANIPSGTFDIKEDGTGGVIFDSGTTLTLLQDDPYNQILELVKSKITLPEVDGSSIGLDLCYDISSSNGEDELPSISFFFDGAQQELPPQNLFIKVNKQETVACLAMAKSGMDIGLIGNLQQQNFHVIYDLENQKLGWAAASCEQV